MKQQHQTGLDLVKFSFLPAQVESNLQSLLQSDVEGRSRWGLAIAPERSNPDRRGMPPKSGGGSDRWFLHSLLQQLSDCHRPG